MKTIKYFAAVLTYFALASSMPVYGQNSVQTRVPRKGITSSELPSLTPYKDSVMTSIVYLDSLGWPIQSVQRQASPLGKDVVIPMTYDGFNREVRKYLPYVTSTTTGAYQVNALVTNSGVYNFYSAGGSGIASNSSPFSQTVFEPSPLDRTIEQGSPGLTWQPGTRGANSGRTVVLTYAANDQTAFSTSVSSNAGSRRAVYYYVDASGNLIKGTANSGYYNSNTLTVTISKDENWISSDGCFGTTEEYKNKNGQLILKRTYNRGEPNGTVAEMLSTYYVYDDIGNLRFVLPPGSLPDANVPTGDYLNNFCYQYGYDNRNRLIQKRIPGKDWEYIIYNKLDQVIFTQDGNQRSRAEWSFIKYDALGREIMTGIESGHSETREQLQDVIDYYNNNPSTGLTMWEKPDINGYYGYTNTAVPTDANRVAYVVNYYDNYTVIPNKPSTFITPSNTTTMTRGLLTGTITVVLGTSNALYTVNYYDNNGRVTTTYKQHYYSGTLSANNYDKITTTYNFNDQPTTVTRQHFTNTGTVTAVKFSETDQYIYDHMGRKLKSWQTLTGTPRTLINKQTYNEVGQLWMKDLHTTDTVANNYKQRLEYVYNERGWLKGVNKDAVAAISATKLFGMELYYNDGPGTFQYNGNISAMNWRTSSPATFNDKQVYAYTYDDIDRLKFAQYNPALTNSDKFNEQLSYDLMGNIKSLQRKNSTTAGAYLNNLTYDYLLNGSGNKLWKVTDGATNYTYSYDLNGNALTDSRNQITNISYNLLNLPQTITRTSGSLTYTYDATGNKLKRVSASGTREYIGGLEYAGTSIAQVATEEGRAIPSGGGYTYEYFLKDHLGNTRAVVNQGGSIVQVQDYYAFGLDMNPGNQYIGTATNSYKYNGKEKQEETGQYDYGARFYDPVVARWNNIDPLSELNRKINPYNYVQNNPILRIDPDGMIDYIPGASELADRAHEEKMAVQADKAERFASTRLGLFGSVPTSTSNNTLFQDDKKPSSTKTTSIGYKSKSAGIGFYKKSYLNFDDTKEFVGNYFDYIDKGKSAAEILKYKESIKIFKSLGADYTPYVGLTMNYIDVKRNKISMDEYTYKQTGLVMSFGVGTYVGARFGGVWGAAGGFLFDVVWENANKPSTAPQVPTGYENIDLGFASGFH